MKLLSVLGPSAIAHFPVAENMLEEVEGVCHACSAGRFGFRHGLARCFGRAFGHHFNLAALAGDLPGNRPIQGPDLRAVRHAGVTGGGVALRLLAVQEFRCFRDRPRRGRR